MRRGQGGDIVTYNVTVSDMVLGKGQGEKAAGHNPSGRNGHGRRWNPSGCSGYGRRWVSSRPGQQMR